MFGSGARRFAPPLVSSPLPDVDIMTSGVFVNKNHSVGISAYHLQWCPKYRFKVLEGEYAQKVIRASLMKTAEEYDIQVLALEIAADHLHIFVSLPPTLSVAKAIQLLKGRSSRDIFRECPSFRRTTYFKHHFWSRGKFYRSVSNVSSDAVYNYIAQHKVKELRESVSSVREEARQLSLLAFT